MMERIQKNELAATFLEHRVNFAVRHPARATADELA
jgi:hypothetical protein